MSIMTRHGRLFSNVHHSYQIELIVKLIFTYVLRVFSSRYGVIDTQGFQKLLLQDDVAEPRNTDFRMTETILSGYMY